MDNSTDATSTCTECGELMSAEHTCSTSENGTTPQNGSGDEPRIAIPDSLWASGLFKPAFARSAPSEQSPVGRRGSIFDPGYDTEPADDDDATSETSPGDPEEITAEPDHEEGPAPEVAPDAEPEPVAAPETDAEADDEASTSEVEDPWAWTETPVAEAVAAPDLTDAETEQADPFAWSEAEAETDFGPGFETGTAPEEDVEPETAGEPEPYDPFDHDAFRLPAESGVGDDLRPEDFAGEEEAPYTAPLIPEQREVGSLFNPVDQTPDLTASVTEVRDEELADEELADTEPAEDDEDPTAPVPLVPLIPPGGQYNSSELPSAVPFQPGPTTAPGRAATSTLPEPEEPAEEKKKGRRALLIGALVLVLIAAAGGWWLWQRQQDSPIRAAFDASQAQFTTASNQLRAAGSIDQVALAGAEFGKAVPLLEETSEAANEHSSSYATSAGSAAEAELEVARAGAGLADLSPTSLGAWSDARPALDDAVDGLQAASDDVRAAGGSTDDLLTVEVLEQLQQMIGEEIADSAAQNTTDLLDRLGSARLVADWRGIGDDATAQVEPMKDAATEFDTAPARTSELAAYRSFLSALGGLSSLRPAKLDGWEQVKERIENTAQDLPNESARARKVLDTADERIVAARTRFTEWQTTNAAAKTEKEEGLEQLRVARETVPGISDEYATLRTELDAIIQRGDTLEAEGAGGEANRLLLAAAEARESLRDRLSALSVPSGATSQLAALVTVISDDAGAVRWASDAAADCVDACDITTRPGWNTMVERAAGSGAAWDAARESWATAADEARAELRAIELPKRPKI